MKTIAWTAILLGVVLIMAACGKTETEPPAKPRTKAESIDSQAAEGPAEEDGAVKLENTTAGAIGKALFKGVTGGSESNEDDPGEAPPFEP